VRPRYLTLDEEVIGVPYKVTLGQGAGRRVKVIENRRENASLRYTSVNGSYVREGRIGTYLKMSI